MSIKPKLNPTASPIIVMVCEDGLYIKKGSYGINSNERFNKGECELLPTWLEHWYLLKGAKSITSYEVHMSGERVNYRWELIDKNDNAINLPEMLSPEDAHEGYDDYDCYHFIGDKCEYYKYRSLYNRVYDTLPDTWNESDYEIDDRGTLTVTEVNNFTDMKVKLQSDCWDNNSCEMDLSSIVTYSDFDQILTPPLAIHNRPCKITSSQTYRIIRAYVKDNIEPKYAQITSDYDFCFTVKKRIPIKPYVRKTEIKKSNGRSYRRPKFNTTNISHTVHEIFEMTHRTAGYQNYTIIRGFEGESLADLQEQVRLYLDELIERINEPLIECECCSGYGHVINPEKD